MIHKRVSSTMRRTIIHVLLPVIDRSLSPSNHDTWIQLPLVAPDVQLARCWGISQNPTRSNRCSLCATYRKNPRRRARGFVNGRRRTRWVSTFPSHTWRERGQLHSAIPATTSGRWLVSPPATRGTRSAASRVAGD